MNQRSKILIITGTLFIITGVIVTISNKDSRGSHSREELPEIQKQESFKNFISGKFSQEYFKVSPGNNQGDSSDADLKVAYEFSWTSGHIFLYTKWIKRYYNNRVKLASKEDLSTFRTLKSKTGSTAFRIVGIGGEPDRPKLLYAIPLGEIHDETMHVAQMKQYKIPDVFGDFYFDTKKQTLQ